MRSFEDMIRRYVEALDESREEISLRWREHANRRTTVVLVLGGALAALMYLYAVRPPDTFPIDTLVSVPSGESISKVALDLQEDGVVRSAFALRVLVVLMGHARTARAGDYLFKEPKDVFAIARAISLGEYGLEPLRVRVPEGATTKEMAVIFGTQLQRFDAERFLSLAQPLEGYLFPDTYFFLPNANENTVIQAMRQNFDTHEASIDPDVLGSGHSLRDIVIIASILEREAKDSQDRRMISGVLWNRLARGMPLQVDATFLYTIGKGTFQLTVADLKSDSRYNTYVHKGLPPTPIGSPSLDSLLAAALPIKSDYLYYLADREGITHYSKTYEEHLRKKAQYLD